jgi:DNA-binding MarR family transcriptional regulator
MIRDPDKADYEQAARLREAVQRFLRESERITRAHGLTVQRYQLMLMIKTSRDGTGRASFPELRERLQLAQSTIVELVQRAEELRLVRRELSPAQRRLVLVCLTRTGERRLARAVADHARDRERLIKILSELS